ncbi:unnamed protein product [Gordionus sp. m RMFG-2023]
MSDINDNCKYEEYSKDSNIANECLDKTKNSNNVSKDTFIQNHFNISDNSPTKNLTFQSNYKNFLDYSNNDEGSENEDDFEEFQFATFDNSIIIKNDNDLDNKQKNPGSIISNVLYESNICFAGVESNNSKLESYKNEDANPCAVISQDYLEDNFDIDKIIQATFPKQLFNKTDSICPSNDLVLEDLLNDININLPSSIKDSLHLSQRINKIINSNALTDKSNCSEPNSLYLDFTRPWSQWTIAKCLFKSLQLEKIDLPNRKDQVQSIEPLSQSNPIFKNNYKPKNVDSNNVSHSHSQNNVGTRFNEIDAKAKNSTIVSNFIKALPDLSFIRSMEPFTKNSKAT